MEASCKKATRNGGNDVSTKTPPDVVEKTKPQKSPLNSSTILDFYEEKQLVFFGVRLQTPDAGWFYIEDMIMGLLIPATASCHVRHLILEHRQGYSMTLMCTACFLLHFCWLSPCSEYWRQLWPPKTTMFSARFQWGHILPILDGKAGGA